MSRSNRAPKTRMRLPAASWRATCSSPTPAKVSMRSCKSAHRSGTKAPQFELPTGRPARIIARQSRGAVGRGAAPESIHGRRHDTRDPRAHQGIQGFRGRERSRPFGSAWDDPCLDRAERGRKDDLLQPAYAFSYAYAWADLF